MSKIKNCGLDQCGKVQSLNGIGGERVNDASSLPVNIIAVNINISYAVALWQRNGLAIYRSRVRVLAGRHCVVALGKLLTPVCLCHQAV